MNYFRIKTTLIIAIVLLPLLARGGGSSYSRYGFGDILLYGDNQIDAMGGTGIALVNQESINLLNPAGMSRINITRFSIGFEYDRFTSNDANGSSFYSMGGFQGLVFAIPVSKENGVVLAFEAIPYSKVSYAIQSSLPDEITGSIQNFVTYGSGGLSYLGLGLSVSPLSTLHLGGRLNYLYGHIRQYQTSDLLSTTTYDRSFYYSGFTFTGGAIYEGLGQLLDLSSLNTLSFGVTFSTATSLDVDGQWIFSGSDTTHQNGSANIPLSVGLGLSYLHHSRYRILGDVVFENWGSLKQFDLDPIALRNSYRTSIGFEAIPEKGADTFWKRVFYRAGLAYNSTYYQVNGVGINEFLVTGGLGLPMGYESWINIGLQVGSRGTTDNKLQKDMIIRLSVAVSASELWFLKFDEE
jgi:hypothetical protein